MARRQSIAAAIAGIAAILLAPLALTAAVRADEDETTATAPENLHPTQVIAEIPDGYNELFPLQWGGGSLYQLKARLATMGCIANTIWNYDDDAWHVYNQYNVPSTLNAEWLAAYEEFVPAGTLYADCFDICDFNYFEVPRYWRCWSLEATLERVKVGGDLEDHHQYPLDALAECTDDWDERIKARVLLSMAVYPDVCIVRQEAERSVASAFLPWGVIGNAIFPYYPGYVVVYKDSSTTSARSRARELANEIHELCHSNQNFQFIQEMQPDKLVSGSYDTTDATSVWLSTEAGGAFPDLVGMVQDADGEWLLPDDSPYQKWYKSNVPVELAAELCMSYFVDKMGEMSDYRSFDPELHLPADVVEWIEAWVALPEIPAPETGEAMDEPASDAQSQ